MPTAAERKASFTNTFKKLFGKRSSLRGKEASQSSSQPGVSLGEGFRSSDVSASTGRIPEAYHRDGDKVQLTALLGC